MQTSARACGQVEHCLDAGIEAALWNSSTSEAQKATVIKELASSCPDLRLLYTTPESLLKPQLRDALKEAHESGTLCAFAVDVSAARPWGCRPSGACTKLGAAC